MTKSINKRKSSLGLVAAGAVLLSAVMMFFSSCTGDTNNGTPTDSGHSTVANSVAGTSAPNEPTTTPMGGTNGGVTGNKPGNGADSLPAPGGNSGSNQNGSTEQESTARGIIGRIMG